MFTPQEQQYELQSFLRLAESMDEGKGLGGSFRTLVLQRDIPSKTARYLLASFTEIPPSEEGDEPGTEKRDGDGAETGEEGGVSRSAGQKSEAGEAEAGPSAGQKHEGGGEGGAAPLCARGSEQWVKALEKPGVPMALQLLTALVKGHKVR